jgi:PAS domain-containing protein
MARELQTKLTADSAARNLRATYKQAENLRHIKEESSIGPPLNGNGAVRHSDQHFGQIPHHDSSVLKLAEENLLHTRQLLVEAQRMAKMGNWSFDPVKNIIYWSEGMFVIHGMPTDGEMTPQQTIAVVMPEDQQLMMEQMVKGRVNGQQLSITYRIVRADNGEVRNMRSISEMEVNAEGEMIRIYGITKDVTEKRAAEKQQLIQHENREKRAAELVIANTELAFQNREKEARAAELVIANVELVYQNNEKEARDSELAIANEELVYQNNEKEARASELVIANAELVYQNNEKEARALELAIANEELVYQNNEKEARASELVIANEELVYQNNEKEARALELAIANEELVYQNNEKKARASELVIANEELVYQNNEKEARASELAIANAELVYQNKEKEARALELVIANEELVYQNNEKEARALELAIANAEMVYQNNEKEARAAELAIANAELVYQNNEKEARASELVIANKELVYQNKEKEARASELAIANAELVYQNNEKEARAAELAIANAELVYQNNEKEARAAELAIANAELVYQNNEKEARASELVIANKELVFQNKEREARALELVIANAELAYQNNEKEARASELVIANKELVYQNKEKERRATALIATNKELKQAHFERDNLLMAMEQRVKERTAQLASKNKDVMDSINYAHRIQVSLLSPFSQLVTLFEQSFILDRPRNIVSGDFFWCFEKGDRKYIVVADCTGHGVPGAILSIIGNNLLNEVIIHDNIQDPSEILMQLDIRLKKVMQGDLGEVRDGMDLALCVVDTTSNELILAGALRPIFITDTDGGIREIRGSRHCIGGAVREAKKHFENHRLSLAAGLRIYLTSDGYASQFGGPSGRKFLKSKFRSSLAALQHLPMSEQCIALKETFADWQGTNEQVDDVLVVGIEF